MATINQKDIVDEIIANDGHYEGDPRVVKIVEYNNQFNGDLCWGLVYAIDGAANYNRYEESGACLNPKVIFEAK